jgi:hypothetical protein
MRFPLPNTTTVGNRTGNIIDKIQEHYKATMTRIVMLSKAEAMLANGSPVQVNTFDPRDAEVLYNKIINLLSSKGWISEGVSTSVTEDLHRKFCQISKRIAGKLLLTGHFALQYHALPYYKSDERITEIQSELSNLEQNAGKIFVSFSSVANGAIEKELANEGLESLGNEELLTKMFEDEELCDRLSNKAKEVEQTHPEFEQLKQSRDRLIAELNNYVIEFYQSSPALIDSNKLLTGEEGFAAYFDIEIVNMKDNLKKREKQDSRIYTKSKTLFDASKVSSLETDAIVDSLTEVAEALAKLEY